MGKGLNRRQMAAIRLADKAGLSIASDCPEIADDYRAGKTISEIAADYMIEDRYGLTYSVAQTAVGRALRELIDESELARIEFEHHSACGKLKGRELYENKGGAFSLTPDRRSEISREAGRISGRKTYEEGKGIFSISPERRSEISRETGKATGNMTYREGKGIFSLTPEEKAEACRKGGISGAARTHEIRGLDPWSGEEFDCFVSLCDDPEYQFSSGPNRGRPDYRAISAELGARFGTKRSKTSLASKMNRMKGKGK